MLCLLVLIPKKALLFELVSQNMMHLLKYRLILKHLYLHNNYALKLVVLPVDKVDNLELSK